MDVGNFHKNMDLWHITNHSNDLAGSHCAYIHKLGTCASHQHSILSEKQDLGGQVCLICQPLHGILAPPLLLSLLQAPFFLLLQPSE